MRVLLDTHAFLWFVLNDRRLSANARSIMVDPGNDLLLSPASYWEIAIKVSLGRYQLHGNDFATFMNQQIATNRLGILPVSVAHAAAVSTLPYHHRDPFDRLLIAQAIVEGVPLLSDDSALDSYPITRVW